MVGLCRCQLRRLVQMACVAIGAGCAPAPQSGQQATGLQHQQIAPFIADQGPLPFDADRVRQYPEDILVLGMVFDVQRFIVPADKVVGVRETIWRYVDELRVDPATTAHLKKNGFRVGVVSSTQIGALRELLDELEARSERTSQTVQRGFPLTLDLGSTGDNRTVYIFRPDGLLEGRTFDNATKFLHIDYNVELVDQRPRTTLGMTPELFQESERRHYQASDGRVLYEKQYEGEIYHELAVKLPTVPGEVLVVGPSDTTNYPFILGSTILGDETGGRRWEIILCVAPHLYRAPGARGLQ